jgi:hypothetical protein
MTGIPAFLTKSCSLAVLTVGLCCAAMGQVSVLTQHNDNSRTGQNNSEAVLTTSNVNVTNFGKLFALPVDGSIYAQPLYMANLTIKSASHNVVFVATEHNSVYAFDADDPTGTMLWHNNLGPSMPNDDVCGGVSGCYRDLVPEIGITGTPVIDPQAGVLYAAIKNKDTNGTYHYRLHALSITTGQEVLGGPMEISATNFVPLMQLQRPGLLLSGGNVYIAFGSEGDFPPYYGFIMAYNASTLAQVAVRNLSPSLLSGGSVWSGGQGPVADSAGNVYVVTSNGDFNANTGGSDYSTSFLKLDGSTLSVLDYFTPYNQAYLGEQNDLDLGAGGPLLIPGTTLLLGGGKDGILRVVDSTDMGKFTSGVNNDVQEWSAISGLIMGAPVYWNSPTLGPVVYMWGSALPMRAWSFNGQTFQTSPVSQGTIPNATGYTNMAPSSISSNGSTAGTGIVWAATPVSGNSNQSVVPGQLWAFDAGNLANELWDSQQNSSRDSVGTFAKFNPPTIANGKVYLATFSGQLVVYGLLGALDFSISASPSSQSVVPGSSTSYIVYVTPQAEFSGTATFTCTGLPTGASCSPATVSVPAGGGQVSTPVSVNTAASTPGGTSNFTITGTAGSVSNSTTATLSVTTFALAASTLSPATITAGGSATSTVTVTPSNGFNSTINLTCAVTPATAVPPTCKFSSSTVNSAGGTPTLTVSTVSGTASLRPNRAGGIYYAMLLPLCGLTLLGAKFRPRSRNPMSLLMICLMFSGLIWMAACGTSTSSGSGGGKGGPATTAGSYTVTVTATSGTLTQTQTLAVTVQ